MKKAEAKLSRDHNKLKVFGMSDDFVVDIYKVTKHFPREELFGLTSQLRRASVSIPANIVEGSGREGLKDYVHFLQIALASLKEAGYLLSLSKKLNYFGEKDFEALNGQYENLAKALNGLILSLKKVSRESSSNIK